MLVSTAPLTVDFVIGARRNLTVVLSIVYGSVEMESYINLRRMPMHMARHTIDLVTTDVFKLETIAR